MEGNDLLPGLFDVHTHISTLDQAQRALESGVTTVRSASVSAFQDVALRELVRQRKLLGPDVVAAGVYVTPNLEESLLAEHGPAKASAFRAPATAHRQCGRTAPKTGIGRLSLFLKGHAETLADVSIYCKSSCSTRFTSQGPIPVT